MPQPHHPVRSPRIALAVVFTTALVTACDLGGASIAPPAVLHFTAYYFQHMYVPSLHTATAPVCASVPSPADQHWYVYVEMTGVDNSASGASDFTFDPANLTPQGAAVTKAPTLTGYLDPYWMQTKVDVPAGKKLDTSTIHQGATFLIDFGQSTPASGLSDSPPVLYTASVGPGTVMQPDPHQTFVPPESAQPTNASLADVHDVPLVTAGPCS